MRRSSRFQRPGLSGSSRSVVLLGGDGGGPSLNLDFSSGTLDPRITFTRSTIGTFYRGAFNQNLLLRSQEFDNTTTWSNSVSGTGSTPVRTANNAVAPDGTTTADTITFNAGAGTTSSDISMIGQSLTGVTSGQAYTLSLWIRASSGNPQIVVRHVGNSGYTLVTATSAWQRISITEVATSTTSTPQFGIRQAQGGIGTINSTATVEVWGAQITEGSLLTPYIPTTTAAITQGQIAASQPWNLLLQSQAFDNTTTWGNVIGGTGVNPVRTANNATAPDGTMTADTITFDSGSGTLATDRSQIAQTVTGVLSGRQYTLSFWIRSQSGTAQLNVRHVGGSTHTLVTATTTWQRVTITETEGGGASVQIGIRQNTNGTINSTATVELWGAQLNEGATALDYSPTTTQANYLPRFEYNPVSGAFRGLLIEGGATNLCLQSESLYTGWTPVNIPASASNVITSPAGTVTADAMTDDSVNNRHYAYSNNVAFVSGTTYTMSVFAKAGTATAIQLVFTSTEFGTDEWATFDLANGVVGSKGSGVTGSDAIIQPVGNGWYRCVLTSPCISTGTTPGANIGLVNSNASATRLPTYVGSGQTAYLWGAQVESQAFASSYIPTVGGTVARAADSAVMTGTNFSSWYNETEGTLLCFHAGRPTSASGRGAEINNNTNDERHALSSGGGTAQYVCTDNGSTQASIGFTIPDADQKRYAAAYRVNDFGLSVNGNTTLTDLTGNLPTVDRLWIGSSSASASFLQSTISRISYWPTRLPNDQLVSLTTIPSTALAMTAIQAGAKIDLTWTQVPGVEGATYEVERSTDGGATWSPLTTSFGLAFNDTTALFPGTYTYRVRANVGGEVTDWSSQVSETTVDVPSAPGSLTVTGATTSSISLSWTDSTGEDFYGIEVSPDGLGSWSLAGTAPANTTTFTHTPLNESTQRYYRVNGINKAGGGVYSSTVNSWTVPLAPTSLTATAVSSTQIDLAWTDVSTGNQSYKVERSTDNVNWTQIATGLAANATSYSAVGLTGSTLYYFRVRAANAARDSAYSNTASATTQAGGLTPAWSLDFSTGSFSGATLTRASSGTFVNSSGYVASASTNVARLTHDKNGARLGLLIEESRANILTRSEDFATGWAGGNTNVVVNDTAAPDNATTADKIAANTTTGAHWRRLGATSPVAGTTYVFSCFFKTGGGNATHAILSIETTGTDRSYTVKYDTSTGARTDTDSSGTPVNTDSPTQAEDMGNGWWRAWVRIEHSTGNTGLRAYVGLSNAATGIAFPSWTGAAGDADFIYFWGTQVEASTNVPTSYIPTTTSGVTRSADLVHVLDSAITSWGDPGALVVHFYPPSQAGTLLSTDDAATAQVGIEASTVTDVRAFWSSGSTAAETMTTGVQKAVHYWTGSTSKLCLNGGPVRSGTNNFTIANADFVTLGAEATDSAGVPGTFSQYANCIIRKVDFYSGTLSDANLQTITT